MTNVISEALRKTLKSDSTVIINSLLHRNALHEKLTDEEKIAAGFFALIDGPCKISYGLLMIAAGTILAPIPVLVLNVSTTEITDEHGMSAEMTGIGLSCRTPKTPFHYHRKEVSRQENRVTITDRDGWMVNGTLKCMDSNGTLLQRPLNPSITMFADTTVTGLNLATTGLGRVIVGIVDPISGLAKSGFFACKLALKACHTTHHTPDELAQASEKSMQLSGKV